MSAAKKARIRDRRKPGWFRTDDEIIDVYGPTIGTHGIAIYCAICRYANKEESSHPSLRTLCEKLKMGRKKLLDTLNLLKEVGLIDIEPGDRVNVNIYHLLEVPKTPLGGSNENHLSLEGGSNENHGWFYPEPEGGSNENRNQNKYEPDILNQKGARAENNNVHYLDSDTRETVQVLMGIAGWDKNEAKTLDLVSDANRTYPRLNLLTLATDLAFKMRTGAVTKYKQPSRAFANWASSSNERTATRETTPQPRIRSREI